MCGILLYFIPTDTNAAARADNDEMLSALHEAICRRGPDHCGSYLLATKTVRTAALLCSSVLHIQGSSIVKQPYVLDNGDVLGMMIS